MAKIIDYPRGSLRNSLQLADAVDGFAGNCSIELAAEKLGKKVSGAFQALISSAVKYGLIDNKAGKLSTTQLYRDLKLAYTPEESAQTLRRALLAPPLFSNIYERFKGQKLPISHFEKMLVREFDVPDDLSSRVSGYFLEGAKQAGLLDGDVLIAPGVSDSPAGEIIETGDEDENSDVVESNATASVSVPKAPIVNEPVPSDDYWLNIRGPGMNFSIEIKDSDDLEIVGVMLKKISKALKTIDQEEL